MLMLLDEVTVAEGENSLSPLDFCKMLKGEHYACNIRAILVQYSR